MVWPTPTSCAPRPDRRSTSAQKRSVTASPEPHPGRLHQDLDQSPDQVPDRFPDQLLDQLLDRVPVPDRVPDFTHSPSRVRSLVTPISHRTHRPRPPPTDPDERWPSARAGRARTAAACAPVRWCRLRPASRREGRGTGAVASAAVRPVEGFTGPGAAVNDLVGSTRAGTASATSCVQGTVAACQRGCSRAGHEPAVRGLADGTTAEDRAPPPPPRTGGTVPGRSGCSTTARSSSGPTERRHDSADRPKSWPLASVASRARPPGRWRCARRCGAVLDVDTAWGANPFPGPGESWSVRTAFHSPPPGRCGLRIRLLWRERDQGLTT